MSVDAISWAKAQPVKPSAAKFVLVMLADYADEHGYCYPGQKRLAQDTSQSERSVRDHLAALERDGWIRRERRRRPDGTNASDGFVLCFDRQPANFSAGTEREQKHATGKSRQRQISPAADFASGEKQPQPPAESAGHEPSVRTIRTHPEGGARTHGPPMVAELIPHPNAQPSAKPRKGVRLEADWSPSDRDYAYAVDRGWSAEQIRDMAEDFREYFTNGRGRNETSPDWSLRWQRWVRQQEHYGRRPSARVAGGFATGARAGSHSAHRNLADAARRAAALVGGRGW